MSLRLLGTGASLPENILSNDDLARMVDTSDEWIFTHTGIRERRVNKPGDTIFPNAAQAAQTAIRDAGIAPGDISLLICATGVGGDAVPSLACQLLVPLGIKCPAFDINAECSGFIYALYTANAMLGEGYALIVSAEQLSKFTDYTDRRTNILFGDGAAAIVVGRGEGLELCEIFAVGDATKSLVCPGLNHLDENGNLAPSYLYMDGPEVFKFATREMMRLIRHSLAKTGKQPDDIKYYIPHQANVRIIKSCAERMHMPLDRFYVNIDRFGNTSSASIPIAMDEMRRGGLLSAGDTVLLAAFGAGWTSGCAVWTI